MQIHKSDNVYVNMENGHKYAACDIKAGAYIVKYGFPIGHATADIAKDELVHTSNTKTNLGEILEYSYAPKFNELETTGEIPTINAYIRESGDIGIRNDVWIINTVGCVNKTSEILARETGTFFFVHPYGCSQLGEDHLVTQKVLRGLVNHPNAGGVLVLGLGCENNHIAEFKKILGDYNPERVKFLNTQTVGDEIAEGVRLIEELKVYAAKFKRQAVPVSKLKVGLKCGGSDGLSGITANPLVGRFSDKLIAYGGSAVLTEVPEMFGAEHLLMERCESREIFDKTVSLINNFKEYYIRHDQEIYENPSSGNKAGGITTLEEKSLGCVQKGGLATVVDVLDYGDVVNKNGLNLLNGPGNDIVAVTNLTAAGCHLILFTTGRGTPLGAPVPTVKISSNTRLANEKPNWIDFDAQAEEDVFDFVLEIANGKLTKSEEFGYREISIFKDGVLL